MLESVPFLGETSARHITIVKIMDNISRQYVIYSFEQDYHEV